MSQKRIAVLTLSLPEPLFMIAVLKDGELHIIKAERLARDMRTLKRTLPEKLKKLQDKDFVVVVDEVVPYFSKYGRAIRLQNIGADDRPIIVSAVEIYRNLTNYKAISYPDGATGTFDIPDSIIEETRDDKGQINYRIDWSEIRPESCALLLSVHAAMSDSLYDSCTATALFEALNSSKPKKPNIFNRFNNIMRSIDNDILCRDED